MASPDTVKQQYEKVCSENGAEPSFEVVQQLTINIVQTSSGGYLLSLCGNRMKQRLGDNDVTLLLAALRQSDCIEELDLRYNNISDQSAQAIANYIKENAFIRAINLMCNDLTAEGAAAIAESLHDNDSLRLLKMNGNKIGNKGGMHFAGMLQINTGLEILDLNDCDLGMESVIALATVVRQNKFLQVLNCSRPLLFSVQEETTVHMGLMLRVNSVLTQLHLVKCDIRDFGAERLAEGLYENTSLKHINLSCNRITRDGARHLAKVLELNATLETLELAENRLEDDGIVSLADSLVNNFTLRCLSVVSNQIKGRGLVKLAESLDINTSLEKLYIWGNELEEDACKAFQKLFESMRLLRENVDVEAYEIDGVIHLGELGHSLRTYYYYTPNFGSDAKIAQQSLLNNFYGSPYIETS